MTEIIGSHGRPLLAGTPYLSKHVYIVYVDGSV